MPIPILTKYTISFVNFHYTVGGGQNGRDYFHILSRDELTTQDQKKKPRQVECGVEKTRIVIHKVCVVTVVATMQMKLPLDNTCKTR